MNTPKPKERSHFTEAHFFTLPSQSNIYGYARLSMNCGVNKVLVSSLRRRVFSLEYSSSSGEIIPTSKEVEFTYIPGAAEIISIDTFSISKKNNDFVVGITLIKNQENQMVHYFNVYSDWDPMNSESLAQYCLSLELQFMPYHLYHTKLYHNEKWETVFLLSGNDKQVHLFLEENNHTYAENHNLDETFPEFNDLPSIVLWMDIVYTNDNVRMTAFGCEDGYIRASLVDINKNVINDSWNIYHDGPISCVKWFTLSDTPSLPTGLGSTTIKDNFKHEDKCERKNNYHLLIGNTFEPTVVYYHVEKNGFNNQYILPNSDKFDCVTSCCIADIDMDGQNEILLGTYGQDVLAYKFDTNPSESNPGNGYYLMWSHHFSHPILSLDYVDITGDGLNELVVMSTRGIHVLQHDLSEAKEICLSRLIKLLSTN